MSAPALTFHHALRARRCCCAGEKQIEVDRRILKSRMAKLKREIEEVRAPPSPRTRGCSMHALDLVLC